MDVLIQDVRHAARRLARRPGFTAVAVASLALAIGGGSIVFSVANALLLRPLPVEDPGRIAAVFTSDYSGPLYGASSYPDYVDFRDKTDVFSGLAAYAPQPLSLGIGEETELILGEAVTGSYFPVLGIRAERGRLLRAEDDAPGAPLVAVVSHGLWSRRFGGDEAFVGGTITLGGHGVTVVGVAPPTFPGLMRGLAIDAWVPVRMRDRLRSGDALESRGSRGLFVIGRLKPSVAVEQAQARFDVLARQLREAFPEHWSDVRNAGRKLTVLPESRIRILPELTGNVVGILGLLGTVVGLVLLIACANVANLLIARIAARRKEIAVRLSLGARRGRLVREFLTESVLAALCGGAAGALVALWATDLLSAWRPPLPVPLRLDLRLDARVLAFTFGLSVLTGIAVGLAPALQASRPDLVAALRDDAAGSPRRSRLRGAFVVSQVALSLVLLLTAALFLKSLRNAAAIDPGFGLRNGLLLSVDLSLNGYPEAKGRTFYEAVAERVAALPGVESAGWTTSVPLDLSWMRRRVWIGGYAERPNEDMEQAFAVAGPGFFQTLGVPLVRGRGFTERDAEGAPRVAVVNETFARRYWPGQDPLGMRLSASGEEGPFHEVVGIAKDGKYWTLGEEPRPFLYLPLSQSYEPSATLVVRTAGDPSGVAREVRGELQALDKGVTVLGVKTLSEHVGLSLLPARAAGTALGFFGSLGLLLASLGIYGVVAWSAGQRRQEIGLRMALGARRADVLRLVVAEGMWLVGVGVGLGLLASLAATRLFTSFLYGLSPTDPVTFVSTPLALAAVALVASYLPARRAVMVDPMEALRYE